MSANSNNNNNNMKKKTEVPPGSLGDLINAQAQITSPRSQQPIPNNSAHNNNNIARNNAPIQGYLHKLSPHSITKSTKKRWFVLHGENLFYYHTSSDSKPLGVIELNKVEKVYSTKKECFNIVTPKREFVLFTQTEGEVIFWLNSFKNFTNIEVEEISRPKLQNSNSNSPSPIRLNTNIQQNHSPPHSPLNNSGNNVNVVPIPIARSYSNSNTPPVNHLPANRSDSNPSIAINAPNSPIHSNTKISANLIFKTNNNNNINNNNNNNNMNNNINNTPPRTERREVGLNKPPQNNNARNINYNNKNNNNINNNNRIDTNMEVMKRKMQQLEDSEQQLAQIRKNSENASRREFKLLLKRLNSQQSEPKIDLEISQLQHTISRFENQLLNLEKTIENISSELQNTINNQMNWERFKKLNSKMKAN